MERGARRGECWRNADWEVRVEYWSAVGVMGARCAREPAAPSPFAGFDHRWRIARSRVGFGLRPIGRVGREKGAMDASRLFASNFNLLWRRGLDALDALDADLGRERSERGRWPIG